VLGQSEYEECVLSMAPDDAFTFLSDGVVEARDASGALFGFERTSTASGGTAQAIAEAAKRFGQDDDITVLKLRRSVIRAETRPGVAAGFPPHAV
jgi:serine phosphatase RsbU (regulator of sigma subunit)